MSNGTIDALTLYHNFIVKRFNLPEDGVRTIDEFAEAVGGYKEKENYYRGESELYSTPMVSKLGRHKKFPEFCPVSEIVYAGSTKSVILKEEVHILWSFRKYCLDNMRDQIPAPPSLRSTQWLDFAQHFGAPTRFLDVTKDALTSLFFACWNPELETITNDRGVVWIFSGGNLRTQFVSRTKLGQWWESEQGIADNYLDFFEPWIGSRVIGHSPAGDAVEDHKIPHIYGPLPSELAINQRVSAQRGCFIWSVDPSTRPRGHVFAIIVAADAKKDILRTLKKLGVSPIRLFPDKNGEMWEDELSSWLDGSPAAVKKPKQPEFQWDWPGKKSGEYRRMLLKA